MSVQPQRFAIMAFRLFILPQVNQDGSECIVRRDHAGFVLQRQTEFTRGSRELLRVRVRFAEVEMGLRGTRVQLYSRCKCGQRAVGVTLCFEPGASFSQHFSGGIVVNSSVERCRRPAFLRQLRRGRSADNGKNGRKAQRNLHNRFALSIADPLNQGHPTWCGSPLSIVEFDFK